MAEIVSTEHFWRLMCSPSFLRTSLLSGRIGSCVYVTLEAPEDTPMVEQAIRGTLANLEDWMQRYG